MFLGFCDFLQIFDVEKANARIGGILLILFRK